MVSYRNEDRQRIRSLTLMIYDARCRYCLEPSSMWFALADARNVLFNRIGLVKYMDDTVYYNYNYNYKSGV